MSDGTQVAEALLKLAREVQGQPDLGSTMDAIVRCARPVLPGVDHVGLSLVHRRGGLEAVAGTAALAWELDAMQHELGEGPNVDAARLTPVVVADALTQEQRWPRYVLEAGRRGVRAQVALRLQVEGRGSGCLSLYLTGSDHVEPRAQRLAGLVTAHAALALGKARHEEDLNEALATHKVVGQAIGILSERYEIDGERALRLLVRVSQASKFRLRDIAQELVDHRNYDGLSAGVGPPDLSSRAGSDR